MRHQAAQVTATIVLFLAALWLNDWLFLRLEFTAGINWVYLPAGMRLICTLLFAEAGAVGLLLVSWFVSHVYFFPDDPQRAFMGGILATVAPLRGVPRFAALLGPGCGAAQPDARPPAGAGRRVLGRQPAAAPPVVRVAGTARPPVRLRGHGHRRPVRPRPGARAK
jgi:hypothetical protein